MAYCPKRILQMVKQAKAENEIEASQFQDGSVFNVCRAKSDLLVPSACLLYVSLPTVERNDL